MDYEEIISQIPENHNKGVKFLCEKYSTLNGSGNKTVNVKLLLNPEKYIEFYTFTEAYLISINYPFDRIEISNNLITVSQDIGKFFTLLEKEIDEKLRTDLVEDSRNRFNTLFNNSFSYEFSQGDLERIQNLINELRVSISKSELFTADHRQRLLKRLEKLQGELHKKVSNLDRFWGLIGDAGVALGKFGNDAKPIVDRIREISEIVWRTQARSEELPSGATTPFLPNKTD